MTAGVVSESWAKAIAGWTDPLPPADRDEADRILLEAAAAGVPLQDLQILARSIWETWKAPHPDPDDGNGAARDEDGFEDRSLRLGATFGGAGKLTGDLAAGCAAKLQAIFDALGKHRGSDDWRSVEQRQHDALDEALSRAESCTVGFAKPLARQDRNAISTSSRSGLLERGTTSNILWMPIGWLITTTGRILYTFESKN